jgi:hypothetical protein
MKQNKRLSLDDFKLKKSESQNEIDKLIGGVAATCHTTPTYYRIHLTNGQDIYGSVPDEIFDTPQN